MTDSSSNGASRYQTDKVRVAVIGVGNCASSFVQGVQFYKDADPTERVPGLMHVDLGGYHVRDIEFTAAFDIDAEKVGKDLSEAIWAGQNNTIKFADVPNLGVKVYRGMTHDGLGKYLKERITKAPGETDDIVGILKETKTDVVVSYLPVGSEQATKWYVEQVLEAGCGFVNCIPVFIAGEHYWATRFEKAGLPIIGDDIKSQVGATITHRALARLFHDRGVQLKRTSQLNVGGNMDFFNMLERERSPNSAGIVTDAVRCCKLALNHGLGGPIEGASAYLMKSPPEQYPDDLAREMVEGFIEKYGGAPKLPGKPKAKTSKAKSKG